MRAEALKMFADSKIFVIDKIMSEYEMFRTIKRLKKRYDIGFVAIDYIGLIPTEDKFESRERQIAHISKFFNLLS